MSDIKLIQEADPDLERVKAISSGKLTHRNNDEPAVAAKATACSA